MDRLAVEEIRASEVLMKVEDVKAIGVIGAGIMGHGLAQLFASKGYSVYLHDIDDKYLHRAIENARQNLTLMAEKGIRLESDIDSIMDQIKTTTNLKHAAAPSQLIIEAVPENLELKQKLFQDLEEVSQPETIIGTNSSVISISDITSKCQSKWRMLGIHFWFPPYIIPLVEVIKGKETADETVETTYQFMNKAGKYAVKALKDVPGFIANRLQHALWREAISMIERGIADPATIDAAIKNSFGLRLPVLGPLENADMMGLDGLLGVHSYVFKDIESSTEPSPLLREKVRKGEFGFKTGRGFRSWSHEEMEKSRNNIINYLLDWMKRQQDRSK